MTNSNPWIEWHGGKCPVSPGTRVDLVFRNGLLLRPSGFTAEQWHWLHVGKNYDIVAYRLHVERDPIDWYMIAVGISAGLTAALLAWRFL